MPLACTQIPKHPNPKNTDNPRLIRYHARTMKRVFSIIIFCLTVLGFFAPGRARGHSASWEQANGRQNACAVEIFDSCLISYDAKERLDAVLIPEQDDPTSLVPYLQVSYQGNTPKVSSLTWGSNGDTVTEHFIGDGTVTHTDIDGIPTDYVFKGSFDKGEADCMLCEETTIAGIQTTSFGFDPEQRLNKITHPEGNETAYKYAAFTSETDKRGADNLITVTVSPGTRANPTGGVANNSIAPMSQTYTYDGPFYQLTDFTDFNQEVTRYRYRSTTEKGNLWYSKIPSGDQHETYVYTFNDYGQLTMVHDGNDAEEAKSATSYVYARSNQAHQNADDREGYLAQITTTEYGELTRNIRLQHDHYGRIISICKPKKVTLFFKYNDLDQLFEMGNPPLKEGQSASRAYVEYHFDARGQPFKEIHKNPVPTGGSVASPIYSHETSEIEFTYDGLARLTEVHDTLDGQAGVKVVTYKTGKDQIEHVKDVDNAYTVFAYDLLGRLEQATMNLTAPTASLVKPAEAIKYTYNLNNATIQEEVLFPGGSRTDVQFILDWMDRPAQVISPFNNEKIEQAWNQYGWLADRWGKAPDGKLTEHKGFYYDDGGMLQTEIDFMQVDTRTLFTFDVTKGWVKYTSPNLKTLKTTYFTHGYPASMETPYQAQSFEYDQDLNLQRTAVGENLDASKLRMANAVMAEHDLNDNVNKVTVPQLNAEAVSANAGNGQPGIFKDPEDVVTELQIGEQGHVQSAREGATSASPRQSDHKVDRINRTASYYRSGVGMHHSYDLAGRLTELSHHYNASSVDNLGLATAVETTVFDNQGRIEMHRRTNGEELHYEYYPNNHTEELLRGRLSEVRDKNNKLLRKFSSYSIFGFPTRTIEYNYVAGRQITVALDHNYIGENGIQKVGYGLLESETVHVRDNGTTKGRYTISYQYDIQGNVTNITLPSQDGNVSYDYEHDSILKKIKFKDAVKPKTVLEYKLKEHTLMPERKTVNGAVRFDYDYKSEDLGLISSIKYGRKMICKYEYDKCGLKNGIAHWRDDPADKSTSAEDALKDSDSDPSLRRYIYDDFMRITSSVPGDDDPFAADSFTFNSLDVLSDVTIDGCQISYTRDAVNPFVYTEFDDPDRVSARNGAPLLPNVHSLLINFQPSDTPVPAGYIADSGEMYQDVRPSGHRYGWLPTENANAIHRNGSSSPSVCHDTFNTFGTETAPLTWRIEARNGIYFVRLVAGDPQLDEGAFYKLRVNEHMIIDGAPSADQRWLAGSNAVEVTDGYLTLDAAPGSTNPVICCVGIYGAGSAYPREYQLAAQDKRQTESTKTSKSSPSEDYIEVKLLSHDEPQGGTFAMTYSGRLIDDDRFHYTWDAFDRIKEVEDKEYNSSDPIKFHPQRVRYVYDSMGRRIARLYEGQTFHWENELAVYDGLKVIEEFNYDKMTHLLRRYFYEAAINQPFMVQADNNDDGALVEGQDLCWILATDERGSLMGVIDENGHILEKMYYNSTGMARPFKENAQPQTDRHGVPTYRSKFVRFGYSGMYIEPFTGKGHTLMRDYDPVHGRWLSRDVLIGQDGLNPYMNYALENFDDMLGASRNYSLMALDYAEGAGLWFIGFSIGAKNVAVGTFQMVTYPLTHWPSDTFCAIRDAGINLATAAYHCDQTFAVIKEIVNAELDKVIDDPEYIMILQGQVTAEIASLFIGAGEILQAAKGIKGAEFVNRVRKVAQLKIAAAVGKGVRRLRVAGRVARVFYRRNRYMRGIRRGVHEVGEFSAIHLGRAYAYSVGFHYGLGRALATRTGLGVEIYEALVEAHHWGKVVAGMHHLMPRALGNFLPYGHRSLTMLKSVKHTALQRALNAYLRKLPKRFYKGKLYHMCPRAYNSGKIVRNLWTLEERIDAVDQFYLTFMKGVHHTSFRMEINAARKAGYLR